MGQCAARCCSGASMDVMAEASATRGRSTHIGRGNAGFEPEAALIDAYAAGAPGTKELDRRLSKPMRIGAKFKFEQRPRCDELVS